jgi:transposase
MELRAQAQPSTPTWGSALLAPMRFPLPAEDLILVHVEQGQGLWRLHVRAASATARCPTCQTSCSRVHSVYGRTLDDAPCAGQRVQLRLLVRRFRCEGIGCPQRLFAERLPEVADPFARRTVRCLTMLLPIALALGGKAAARLLPALGLGASPSTLLRLVRQAPEPTTATPRVLGVDDWALRRGHVYGTILIDLETHRVVDLLPDRTAESLAAWLRQHPGVEIVSRDRSRIYAQGIAEGAPHAIQVADRWHLLKNNLEALERVLQGERVAMTAATHVPPSLPPAATACDGDLAPGVPLPLADVVANDTALDAPSPQTPPTAREQGIYEQVQDLGKKGLSVYKISKKTGFAKATVRKYLEAKACPRRAPRRTKLASRGSFDEHLRRRWQEGCFDAVTLHGELQARGFRGTVRTVQRKVAGWRMTDEQGARGRVAKSLPLAAPPSAREARWWLVLPPEKLSTEQGTFVARLLDGSPRVREAQALALEFRRLLVGHDPTALVPWVQRAEKSELAAYRSFAVGLREDLAAVQAALVLPWSQGQTEGQVTKLKLVKRQGYGRASVALLRKRLVA